MYKRLLRIALISSPVMALYGLTPVYILYNPPIWTLFLGCISLTLLTSLMWTLNLFILKNNMENTNRRYAMSYTGMLIQITIAYHILESLPVDRPDQNAFYPYLMGFAINTIILIFINSELIRERKDKAEAEIQALKLKNMEAQHHLLMRQFQPHFLFNALSTLKSLIKIDQKEADNYLLKLSEFLRFSVVAKDQPLVALEKELKFTEEYLDMQSIRFEDAIFYEVDISKDVMRLSIPVFALQSLVENAIKHNGFSEENPMTIHIENEADKLSISNNKIPKKSSIAIKQDCNRSTKDTNYSLANRLVSKKPKPNLK